jgi:DNA-directed RNA polymerase specialized sigma24 family protein
MAHQRIPPSTLDPLLRGTWTDERAAWDVLLRHVRVVHAACSKVHRTLPANGREHLDDLVQGTLVSIMARARAQQGLSRPEDWAARTDGFPWLFQVATSHAETVARPMRRIANREVSATPVEAEERPKVPEPQSASNPEREVAAALDTERTRALLADPRLKPAHALVYVLRFFPAQLDLSLVERAAEASDAATGEGIVRTAEETYELLRRWVSQPARSESDASRELAWILRSDDRTSSATWRRRDPDAVSAAMDLLRNWRNRAVKLLGGTP